MKNYSLTASGLIVAVAGTFLTQWFSESCTNELITNAPLLIGGIVAWVGRVKAGGVNWFGAKV